MNLLNLPSSIALLALVHHHDLVLSHAHVEKFGRTQNGTGCTEDFLANMNNPFLHILVRRARGHADTLAMLDMIDGSGRDQTASFASERHRCDNKPPSKT
jgi:hypothetical protein